MNLELILHKASLGLASLEAEDIYWGYQGGEDPGLLCQTDPGSNPTFAMY